MTDNNLRKYLVDPDHFDTLSPRQQRDTLVALFWLKGRLGQDIADFLADCETLGYIAPDARDQIQNLVIRR